MTERIFGNVGVLDIRETSESVFADKLKFGNIGLVLFSKQTAPFLKHIYAGNIGATLELETGNECQMIQGKSTLTSDAFKDLKSPLHLLVMGKLVIRDDVSAVSLEKGLGFLQVMGKLVCPSDLLPVVQSKVKSVSGKIETYPSGFRLLEKSMRFDRSQLMSLPAGSKLAIFGNVTFDPLIPKELILERLAGLYVKGDLSIPESLLETLHPMFHSHMATEVRVIPDGYEAILDDVQVGPSELLLWQGAKIYFSGSVRFSSDVQSSDIEHLEAFIAQEDVYCKESLLPVMVKKCDRFKTHFILYKDRLLFNEGHAELLNDALPDTDEELTIVNNGVLTISSDISAERLHEKLNTVRNSGVLFVASHQMGVMQEKAKECDGPILVGSSTHREDENSDSRGNAGNIGVLKL